MSDIIKRLHSGIEWLQNRGQTTLAGDCQEAVNHILTKDAEITRLRAEIGSLRAGAGEVVAWGQLGMTNGRTYLRMVYDRIPYPPPADVARNLNLVPLYTAPSPAAQPDQPALPEGNPQP